MNHWCGMGRLTADPRIDGDGEKRRAYYTLAVDKIGAKGTDFIDCCVFGKGCDFAEKFFHKGIKILVTGSINTANYVDKTGKKVHSVNIVVATQEFCESKKSQQEMTEGMFGVPTDRVKETTAEDFVNVESGSPEELPFG